MKTYKEKEITKPVFLCDNLGNLNRESVGWARQPLITSNLPEHLSRKKKWNYWCVFGRDALFSATISEKNNTSICFIYYVEYDTKKFFEKTVAIPFDKNMPEKVQESIEVMDEDVSLSFIWNHDHTSLKVNIADFDGKVLQANIRINYPSNLDTLNVVVPWSDELFQFTSKQHCLPAEGSFSIGDKTFGFDPKTDFAVLDYGRGVWPHNSIWNWGMASGKQNQDVIGLNFGGQWTDNTGSNENAVIVNGELTKISEDVKFIYDRTNFMKPWEIKTEISDQVNLTFEPFYERIKASDSPETKTEVHQMVGNYYGVITVGGKTIKINNLLGCIEEHIAQW